jgi:La domain
VEYYFSDQNLATDQHLLALSGGSLNLPVALGEILGWRKMRKFKPKSKVIASLKKSTILEVIDGKTIRRRVPFTGTVQIPEEGRVLTINQKVSSEAEKPVEVRVPAGYIMHNGVIRRMAEMSVSISLLSFASDWKSPSSLD